MLVQWFAMALVTLGLSHHSAPVEVRGRLAFTDADVPAALERLRALPGVRESAILSTCNRTEIMAVAESDEQVRLREWWCREREIDLPSVDQYFYTHRDHGSVLHSLRVASGLDSLVIGEPQILGQMKASYATAQDRQSTGPVLSRLFQHAFSVAKLVRSRTEIGAHPVSVAYAAVQMSRRIFADLSKETALLIGAGEFMQLLGRHLQQHGVGRIIVANRSLDRAEKLARELGGYAISLNDLASHLPSADLLISSTGARGFVVESDAMQRAIGKRRRKPVFMIDLAVPRDIDPSLGELEDVYLYTIDDLRQVIEDNMKTRQAAAQQAESLVEEYASEFTRWMEGRDAAATVRELRQQAREQRDQVLDKARRKLAAGMPPEAALEFVANTLSNKLLHGPSQALRNADAIEQALLVNGARRLFDLKNDDE